MTIAELLAATGLTANDLVPIWDAEAAQNVEPTQKVTAAQLAAAVKVLAALPNTTEMNAAIQQSTAYSEGEISTGTYTSNRSTLIAKVRKHGNHVWLDLRMVFTNSVKLPTSTSAATVPTGYRPTSDIHIPALIQANNADAWTPYEVVIGMDGSIKQNFTASCTGIAILSSGYFI